MAGITLHCVNCGREYDAMTESGRCFDCPDTPLVDLKATPKSEMLRTLIASAKGERRKRVEDRSLLIGLLAGATITIGVMSLLDMGEPVSLLIFTIWFGLIGRAVGPLWWDRRRPPALRLFTDDKRRRRQLPALLVVSALPAAIVVLVLANLSSGPRAQLELWHDFDELDGAPYVAAVASQAQEVGDCLVASGGTRNVMIRWQIEPAGSIRWARVLNERLPAAARSCFEQRVGDWNMPPSPDDSSVLMVNCPFSIAAGEVTAPTSFSHRRMQ